MLMDHIRRIAVFLTVLIMAAGTLFCSSPVDYSDPDNWAYYGIGEGKDADLFLICPTVDMGTGGNLNMSMDDEKVKANFTGALNMERGIYEDSAVMYAPFYRQIVFPLYLGSEEYMKPYLDIAYDDVSAAFEYYMENINDGRPLILAGFSQGAQHALRLLEDYFDDPEYSDLLVAAYCIGWRITAEDLAKGGVSDIEERIRKAYPAKKPAESIRAMAADIGAGDMTVKDIVDELKKPARDPREDAPPVVFRNDVRSFDDLEEGMELTGTVRNVVDFGAFVDIGVKNDGLVHVSQLSHKYVKHPMDVVAVGDTVKVKILGIDRDKQKVSLTMKL